MSNIRKELLQQNDDGETSEIRGSSDLESFLRESFFAGYVEAFHKGDYRLAHDLSSFSTRTIEALFRTDLTTGIILTGSMPKNMIAMPEHFWDYATAMKPINAVIAAAAPHPEQKRVVESDPDLDVKLKLKKGDSLQDVLQALRAQGLPEMPGSDAEAELLFGQIGTNKKKERITVVYKRGDETLFHIDITTYSSNALEESQDLRYGFTSVTNDDAKVTLALEGDRVTYSFFDTAFQAMQVPDRIKTKTDEPERLIQIILRSFRYGLLYKPHLVQEISTKSFLPLFDEANSMGMIRDQIRKIALREGIKDLSPEILPMLQKELALCLTIDPYLTILFLRGSGITQFIPGLKIPPDGWEEILHDTAFVVDVADGVIPEQGLRDDRFLNQQRNLYLSGESGFDGFYRFNQAVKHYHSNGFGRETSYEDIYLSHWHNGEGKLLTYTPKDIQSVIRRVFQGRPGYTDKQEANIILYPSVALLYLILKDFPQGLTGRELSEMYAAVPASFEKTFMNNAFLQLKRFSLVGRCAISYNKDDTFVDENLFYPLNPAREFNILDMVTDSEVVNQAVKVLREHGIVTIQTLKALSRSDIQFMMGNSKKATLIDAYITAMAYYS